MIEYVIMTADHVPQVAQLEKECFHDPWSENAVASELKNPLSLWLVAVLPGCQSQVQVCLKAQLLLWERVQLSLSGVYRSARPFLPLRGYRPMEPRKRPTPIKSAPSGAQA